MSTTNSGAKVIPFDPGEAPDVQTAKRDVATRWGGNDRITASGFVAVPQLFLERMATFKPFSLNPAEALFVICVMAHKWDERKPYPSYKRIAGWMGKSESYVRKLAQNLETKGFLKREKRVGTTNAFDFQPLFEMMVAGAEVQSITSRTKARVKKVGQPKAAQKRAS